MSSEVFIVNGLTEGEKARLARVAKGLRQLDIASLAKVSICEVTALEKNRCVRNSSKERIFQVLGLLDEQPEATNAK
jgi:transcriptional regulator with XRE-family HTH domain